MKKEADDNVIRAEAAKKDAIERKNEADLAKKDALIKKNEADSSAKKTEIALEKLKVTSDRAVTILLREIDRNILFLEYDSTFEKCKVALELEAQRESIKHRIQEIAFWQVETDASNFEIPLRTLTLLGIFPEGKNKEILQAEVRIMILLIMKT